jgi:hypothetical protein
MNKILINTIVKYVAGSPQKGDFLVVGTIEEPYKPSSNSHPYNTQIVNVKEGKDFIIIPISGGNDAAKTWPIDGIHVFSSEIIPSED